MSPYRESRTLASLLKTMASIDLRCSGGLRPSANEVRMKRASRSSFASTLDRATLQGASARPCSGLQLSDVNEKKTAGPNSDVFGLIYDWSGATKTSPQGSPKGKRGGAYQYFLDKFAMSEGQKGGERSGATWTLPQERPKGERGGAHQFYTPTSIVKPIVEILEPYHGRVLDPAAA